MLTVNLDHVPGREIKETLGIVMGHARVQKDERGRRFIESQGKKWPWSDDTQHHEMLIREGLSRLEEEAQNLQANCILGAGFRISRDGDGLPEVIFSGTAVVAVKKEEKMELSYEGSTGEVDVSIGDKKGKWVMPTAVGGEADTRSRGRGEIVKNQDDERGKELARKMGISLDIASTLIRAEYDTPEKIAGSSTKELSGSTNMNPTQARLVREKAIEVTGKE